MAVFIRHENCEKCGSSDAKAVYDDGSWHCFSCRATKASDEYLEEVQEQKKSVVKSSVSKIEYREMQLAGKELITENEIEVVVENTSVQGKKFRGIKDETYQKYGVRHQFSESTGQVEEQFYPITKNSEPAGYKVRVVPKTFYSIGATGKECDLFGQRNFKHGGKNILLSEGELDCMSAYQMLRDYYEGRGMHYDVPCVSATTGANSFAQLQNQYKFFDLFENIYVCLDNDKAGEAALEDTIKALPKGKVKIIRMQLKDPNEYLTQGRQKEFVSAYFEAKTYVPDGIIGSGQLYDKMLEYALVERVPLPPFMKKLDSMLGGIELGTIGIFAAGTGAAKCLGKDTPIMMYDRSIKMVQDIVNGDMLMGPDGTPRTVSGVVSGNDNLFRVKQVKGIEYVVNSKHILSLRASTKLPALGLEKGDICNIEIQRYLNLPSKTRNLLKGWKAEYQNFGTKSEVNADDAYILGLWLAEGTASRNQFTLANFDTELFNELDKFSKNRNYEITVYPTSYRENCTTYNLIGYQETLHGFGLIKANKHIPTVFLNSTKEVRLQLLAGFLDGDGHLSNNGYSLCLKNDQLAKDIENLARLLGFSVSVKDVFMKCQNFSGDWYKRIHIYGNTHTIPNRLTRKKSSTRKQIKNPLNTGISVSPIGVGEYFGFELDGDRLFCLGDGTVTHNTTVANELLYYWLFHSPHKIGVVSLELTCAQYGQVLLSRHIQQRIGAIKDVEEKNAFLRRDIIKSKAMELFYDTEGNDRFMVIDERDGQLAILQDKIEELVISCGCKVIILDPVSDLMDGLSNDEQALFAKWCKSMIKNYNIAFLMIAHIRKSASNKDAASTGAFIPEEAIMGSSTMMKSASWIVMMQRDKYNADDIIRNTTILTLSKNRSQGETGPAGEIYYDGATHTLHDKETYFIENQPQNV